MSYDFLDDDVGVVFHKMHKRHPPSLAFHLAHHINNTDPNDLRLIASLERVIVGIGSRNDQLDVLQRLGSFSEPGSALERQTAIIYCKIVEGFQTETERVAGYAEAMCFCSKDGNEMRRTAMEGILRHAEALPTEDQRIGVYLLAAGRGHPTDPLSQKAAQRFAEIVDQISDPEKRSEIYRFAVGGSRRMRSPILRKALRKLNEPVRSPILPRTASSPGSSHAL